MDNALSPIEPENNADKMSIFWQRLSPIAMLYFASEVIKHIGSNFIYLIPAFAVSYKSIMSNPYIGLPAVLILLALLGFFALLSFKVYRYRLTEHHIEIRSGVFNKTHINLPFDRVQNVKIEQPFYYRLSGHACVQLDTAGSAKNEAKLVAIKLDLAEQLKQRIGQYVEQQKSTDSQLNLNQTEQNTAQAQEVLLNHRSLSDLIIHGITSNRIWILLGGLAPFYDNIIKFINQRLRDMGVDLSGLFSLQSHSIVEVILYTISLTMVIMLVLVSFSVAGAIISYYGYTLHKFGDKYIRRSGLITKHEVSMRLSRLQMIVSKQDWLDKLLKRSNLKLEQINPNSNNLDAAAQHSKIIVPSVKPNECQAIIEDALPGNRLTQLIQTKQFKSIDKKFIVRYLGYIFTPIFLGLITINLIDQKMPLVGVFIGGYLLCALLVIMRYRRWGVAFDQDYTYIRKGLFGVDYYCFPNYKLQQCQFKQSVFMRRKQLASVTFVLASGAISVPLINQALAYQLVDLGLAQANNSQHSWM
ncbi:PH domain-containing protein [Paraglaciecola aestuariivivens]